jgi:hypothetical protein
MLRRVTLSGPAASESGFPQASHLGFAVVPKQQQSAGPDGARGRPDAQPLEETRAELERVRADLAELRRAHEAQARHLVVERLAVAENAAALLAEIEELKADVEWRKGVMKVYEDELEILRNSRSIRYTNTLRRAATVLRPRRS